MNAHDKSFNTHFTFRDYIMYSLELGLFSKNKAMQHYLVQISHKLSNIVNILIVTLIFLFHGILVTDQALFGSTVIMNHINLSY